MMIQATYQDTKEMVNILQVAFESDPLIAWFIGNPSDPQIAVQRRKALINYMCTASISIGQAWLSDDRKGVALWQRHDAEPAGWPFLKANMTYLFTCGLASTIRSLQMNDKAHSYFPKGAYLYLGMVGIHPDARGTGILKQLIEPQINKAQARGIPVVLETTSERNIAIYEHYGFQVMQTYSWSGSPVITFMSLI
jgi:GNAT superfamily N-acetyltransferase